jgi:hypothetical protein
MMGFATIRAAFQASLAACNKVTSTIDTMKMRDSEGQHQIIDTIEIICIMIS